MDQRSTIIWAIVIMIALAGCGGNTGELNQETTTISASTTPTQTGGETVLPQERSATPDETPTAGPQTQTSDGTVAVAATTVRVQYNGTAQWRYRGENGTIDVRKVNNNVEIIVNSDNYQKRLTYNQTDRSETRSWSKENLRFVVRPVDREQRDGQSVYVFGDTWNTSHVELEIFCTKDC